MSNNKFDYTVNRSKYKKSHKYYDDYDDEEIENRPKNYIDKRKVRRMERALKTKDLNVLLEDENEFFYDPTELGK
jgi:hypothetical protein